jgi:hypothetical protein
VNGGNRFWLVSPNVWKDESEVDDWKRIIVDESSAFLGWKTAAKKNSMGLRFAEEIQIGDIILIARSHNNNTDMVGFGVVDSGAKEVTRLEHTVQRRKLVAFVGKKLAPESINISRVVNIRRAFCEKKLSNKNNKIVYDWIVSEIDKKGKVHSTKNTTNKGDALKGIKVIEVPSTSDYGYKAEKNKEERVKKFRKREKKLQDEYQDWLKSHGNDINALEFPGGLKCDLWEGDRRNLIEAKATVSREDIRMAVGQILDYCFQCNDDERFKKPNMAILLPKRPSDDKLKWIEPLGIKIIWKQNKVFQDNADNKFT